MPADTATPSSSSPAPRPGDASGTFGTPGPSRWSRLASAFMRGFHAYGHWLAGISWKRFAVLALLLLMMAGMLQNLPPFSWRYTETVTMEETDRPRPERRSPRPPSSAASQASGGSGHAGTTITIDGRGIRITSPKEPASGPAGTSVQTDQVEIKLPPGAENELVREAIEEARQGIEEALRESRELAEEPPEPPAPPMPPRPVKRTRVVSVGESLPEFAFFWIFLSAILKVTYQGRIKAEAQAAQARQVAQAAQVQAERATETAEAEALRRQVVEARMAAMQAQVEPHFLFNTLASIDHLIETDPPRASQMQKHLIALLRAAMPSLREASDGGARDLGRELDMVKPYIEILKVRMEERLDSQILVPEGLLSAEFPPMMIQTLVENAIRHGLEPKPEGGRLSVSAEVAHGQLVVRIIDTGIGLAETETSTTTSTATAAGNSAPARSAGGLGLANIRERLALLYGRQARLELVPLRAPDGTVSGTMATITLPYRPLATPDV